MLIALGSINPWDFGFWVFQHKNRKGMFRALRSVLSRISSVWKCLESGTEQFILERHHCILHICTHTCLHSEKILLSIGEIFTFVWINAVVDYFCSTVSRITELSMKGILSMWMAHSHYDKWALFRTQWSPCWVYWTKCSILLCKVIGPINASRSLKKSTGEKKISIRSAKLYLLLVTL